jgi:hypothetical protein
MLEPVQPIRKLKRYRRPHFLIVGAAKSGTTTLYDDLACHPDAGLPSNKEPSILISAKTTNEALRLWDRHFAGTRSSAIRGEASTKYTMSPEFPTVAEFAHRALGPDLRILYLMRDPISRIESHLAHDRAVGRLDGVTPDRAALEFPRYVSWSDYPRQIRPWVNAFGTHMVKTIVFEDLVENRSEVVQDVAEFVGLDPRRLPERYEVSNGRGSQRVVRTKWLGRLTNSGIYRHYLRGLIPKEIVHLGRKTLTRPTSSPIVKLSSETRIELKRRLAHVGPDLRAMGLEPGDW